jgi:hypothetical protein
MLGLLSVTSQPFRRPIKGEPGGGYPPLVSINRDLRTEISVLPLSSSVNPVMGASPFTPNRRVLHATLEKILYRLVFEITVSLPLLPYQNQKPPLMLVATYQGALRPGASSLSVTQRPWTQ